MPLFLAGLLVRGSALPPDVVEEALQRQVITGGTLDSSLLELGSLDETSMAEYLARASGLPLAPIEKLQSPDVKLRRVLPLRLAERHGLVPFAQEERTVHMACAYPADAALLDEMGFLLSQRIEAHIATEFRIRLAIETLYGQPASTRMHDLARRCGSAHGDVRAAVNPASSGHADLAGTDPPDWSVSEALARLDSASDRHLAIDTVLRFARRAFSFVAVFGVFGGRAVGWDARGPDAGMGRLLEQVSLPLDTHSVLSTVVRTGGRYLGPIPDEEGNRLLLGRIGRRFPESAFVQPVLIGERTVAILYADNGDEPVSLPRAAEVMSVVQALGSSLERMIRSRKAAASARTATMAANAESAATSALIAAADHGIPVVSSPVLVREPAVPLLVGVASPEGHPAEQASPARAGDVSSTPDVQQQNASAAKPSPAPPVGRESTASPGTASSASSGVPAQQRRSPLRPTGQSKTVAAGTGQWSGSLEGAARAVGTLLASRSPAERDAALAGLRDLGAPVADVLTALLPGPIRFGAQGQILGGPVVDALETLGPVAVPALLRAAASPDGAVRYWAAVLLSRTDHPQANQALEVLAGDPDPQVAAASRVARESATFASEPLA